MDGGGGAGRQGGEQAGRRIEFRNGLVIGNEGVIDGAERVMN